MVSNTESELAELKRDNLRLREENQALRVRAEGKNPGLSNDAVDSIVAVVLILVVAFGVSFWLGTMPG